MSRSRKLARSSLLFVATLGVVVVAIAIDRALRPVTVAPAADRSAVQDLSRAMTFTSAPEPKP